MGGPSGKANSALPVREISINSFIISRYEITFDQFDLFCRAENIPLPPDGGYGRGDRPAGNVNWYDAVSYCNWLSEYEGLLPCYQFFPGHRDKGNMSVFDSEKLLVVCEYSKNGYRKNLPYPVSQMLDRRLSDIYSNTIYMFVRVLENPP